MSASMFKSGRIRWRELSDELTATVVELKATEPRTREEWEAISDLEHAARLLFGASSWIAVLERNEAASTITVKHLRVGAPPESVWIAQRADNSVESRVSERDALDRLMSCIHDRGES